MKKGQYTNIKCLLNSYHVFLSIYLLLRFLFGSSWWWLGFLHTFALWLFIPLLLTSPLAFLMQGRKARMLSLLLMGIGLIRFAPLPIGLLTASDDVHDVRVLTFNIWVNNAQIEDSVDWVLAQDADVLILEELVETNLSQLPRLNTAYPYSAYIAGSVRVFSRYPLLEQALVMLEPADSEWDGRAAVRTVIEIDGQAIVIYGVHLSLPRREQPHFNLTTSIDTLNFILRYDESHRNTQIRTLAEHIDSEENPVILAGDFNTSHSSPILGNLTSVGLRDSFRVVGTSWGMTWPYLPPKYPMIRIDYVWSTAELAPLRIQVGEFVGSDHLPLVVDFAIKSS